MDWPDVSSVPGIGMLGSMQGKTEEDSDMIVMITPRLVDFSPRKDHLIYAGRGTGEGEGGFFGGGGRGIDRSEAPVQTPAAAAAAGPASASTTSLRRSPTRILKMKRRRSLRRDPSSDAATKIAALSSTPRTLLPAPRAADTCEAPRAQRSR